MKRKMKSILFMPFLQIPSGHHQVANSLMEELEKGYPFLTCEKVDILAYGYGKIEKFISKVYLNWIKVLPGLYNSIYKFSVYRALDRTKRYRLYEVLFVYFMERLLAEKNPDLIVCTHALPAYMANYLKERNKLHTPVINIYTDFFIHRFWGIDHIDFHFVATYQMKEFLRKKGVPNERIFVTGIPVHDTFRKKNKPNMQCLKPPTRVLLSGGNLGVGGLEKIIKGIENTDFKENIQFYILCGKNQRLFRKLKRLNKNHIVPLPYIQCREKMSQLYDSMDAILTKPGGVTISESLFQRKPIFIFDALPGQEKVNLKELLDLGLAFPLEKVNLCEGLLKILSDNEQMEKYYGRVESFHAQLHSREPLEIIGSVLEGIAPN